MLNGTVLDVAIGLIFVFLMLSVACSLLNERIQSLLDKRAAMLEDALRKLLGDDATSPFFGVQQHALVRALAHSPSGMPSYLPSSTFALALFDTLVPSDGEHPLTFKRLRDAVLLLPSVAPRARIERRGWWRRRRDADGASASKIEMVPTARAALLTLLSAAEGDLAVAREKVEHWFDSSMERLSGAYKRHVNVWLFALGFVLAAATNADSILLVQRLEHEGALRAEVAAEVAHVDTAGHKVAITKDQLEQMDLLFWDGRVVTADQAASYPRAARQFDCSLPWLTWLLFKIAGFVMSALAVSLGAPFWFDLLGRLVNLRATGAKPPKPTAMSDSTFTA